MPQKTKRPVCGFSKKYFKMKIAIKTANRPGFFVCRTTTGSFEHKYRGVTKN